MASCPSGALTAPHSLVSSAASCCLRREEPSLWHRAEDARSRAQGCGRCGAQMPSAGTAPAAALSPCSVSRQGILCPDCTQSPFPGAALIASQRHKGWRRPLSSPSSTRSVPNDHVPKRHVSMALDTPSDGDPPPLGCRAGTRPLSGEGIVPISQPDPSQAPRETAPSRPTLSAGAGADPSTLQALRTYTAVRSPRSLPCCRPTHPIPHPLPTPQLCCPSLAALQSLNVHLAVRAHPERSAEAECRGAAGGPQGGSGDTRGGGAGRIAPASWGWPSRCRCCPLCTPAPSCPAPRPRPSETGREEMEVVRVGWEGRGPAAPRQDGAPRPRPPPPTPGPSAYAPGAVLQSGAARPRHTDTAQTDAWDAVSMDGSGRAGR